MVTVRRAAFADLPWLLEQLAAFDRSFGAKLSLLQDVNEARVTLVGWMQNGIVLIAEEKGTRLGLMVGIIGPHYLCSRIRTLFEVLWWAPPSPHGKRALLALLDAFMAFGRSERVDWIICSKHERVPAAPTFARRGFRPLELSHIHEVTD